MHVVFSFQNDPIPPSLTPSPLTTLPSAIPFLTINGRVSPNKHLSRLFPVKYGRAKGQEMKCVSPAHPFPHSSPHTQTPPPALYIPLTVVFPWTNIFRGCFRSSTVARREMKWMASLPRSFSPPPLPNHPLLYAIHTTDGGVSLNEHLSRFPV